MNFLSPATFEGRVRLMSLAAAGIIAGLLWLDSTSLERGNRLYRAGEPLKAERIYQPKVDAADPAPRAAFNFGTALLSSDAAAAEAHLRNAALSYDSALAQRGNYNLAYSMLIRVNSSLEPDTAIALVMAAVESGRRALRLDPTDENAVWNLALGQRMLDSLTAVRQETRNQEDPGEDETRLHDEALTRSGLGDGVSGLEPPDARPVENVGQRTGAAIGAREAWTGQDPGPMEERMARNLLDPISDSPEDLVRGILWSLRPQVEWWNLQKYPGGNW